MCAVCVAPHPIQATEEFAWFQYSQQPGGEPGAAGVGVSWDKTEEHGQSCVWTGLHSALLSCFSVACEVFKGCHTRNG